MNNLCYTLPNEFLLLTIDETIGTIVPSYNNFALIVSY